VLAEGEAEAMTDGKARKNTVCRWPTMAIRALTMADADAALAVDLLFHLDPGRHAAGSSCALGTSAQN
jgi:hypothetical protein